MIKNAILYVLRKRKRTLIIFIILTIVLSCLYSCLSLLKSSEGLEKSLYSLSNSSLSITKKNDGYFEIDKFKKLENIKEIKSIMPEYHGLAKLLKFKTVEGTQKVRREDLSDKFKNVLALEGVNNTKKSILFNSKVFNIKSGRHIRENDRGKILIHEELAKKNNLKINDEIKISLIEMNSNIIKKEYKFKIIGIFSGKKQEEYTGLSSDFSENMVFIDYQSSQKALYKKDKNKVANKLKLYFASSEDMKNALNKIKNKKTNLSNYNIEKDTIAFEKSLDSISGIKRIIKIMTYLIMIGSIIVLSLILLLWLRERLYEIGILLSIGISKTKIIIQFITELILISLPAIISSFLLGNLVIKEIIGGFIQSDRSAVIIRSFFENRNGIFSLITFLQGYALLIIIIILSVIIACSMILVKKPKEILSKIS